MIAKLKSYFKPTSLAWWGGIGMISFGTSLALGYDQHGVGTFAEVLATLSGGGHMAPAGYILLGLSIIGIRGKQERDGL